MVCIRSRAGETISLSTHGVRQAQMPSEQAGDDAERHGDDDQRQRQHGAGPLAEQRDVEEAAADQQAEPAAADGMAGEEGDGGDDADPGQARQD